jgi:hypothetical protein
MVLELVVSRDSVIIAGNIFGIFGASLGMIIFGQIYSCFSSGDTQI